MLTMLLWYAVVILVALVCLVLWYQTYSRYFKMLKEIPGTPGYPIIGSMLSYLVPQDQLLDKAREIRQNYYPINKDWTFVYAMVHLVHPDDAEIILTSTEHLTKGPVYDLLQPWLGTGLLTSTGSKWQVRRKVLTPAFHFGILQDYIRIFNNETERLVENLFKKCHQESIDVVPEITEFTLGSISETAMGFKMNTSDESCKQYKRALHSFGDMVIYRLLRPWLCNNFLFSFLPAGKLLSGYVNILHSFSRNVIRKRKLNSNINEGILGDSYSGRKRMAMLDLLLSAKEEGFNIDDEGIREEVDTFMFEGHDTTAVALCYILLLLANHTDIQEGVHREVVEVLGDKPPTFQQLKELLLMERCIKESLRLYPSVHMISRLLTSDVKTATGYTIPAQTAINLFIFDLHRNPEFYPDPERFDPDRFLPEATKTRHPFAYIPFSAGPRNCIGQRFAMIELKTALCGILRKFTLEPVDTPKTVRFKADLVLRPQGSIRVQFKIRK